MAIATHDSGAAIAEQVIIKGDLSKLTESERMTYYSEVCRSLGLNPLTRPFEYITLNGKLTLYATRGAADQLRSIRGISITGLDTRQVGDLIVVVATGRDRAGRDDSATGAVSAKGLQGEALANAMMKAETKAKRRLTLSLAGLGWPDETEVASIPGAIVEPQDKPLTLAEKVAAKAAEVASPDDDIVTVATGVSFDAPPPVAEGQEAFDLAPADTAATVTIDDPNDLTVEEFRSLMAGAKIQPPYVKSVVQAMFPGKRSESELTGDQRGALAREILSGG